MGKSAPSAPATPSPQATAAAQSASNSATASDQAALNNVSQYTPEGNSVFTQNGSYTDSAGNTVPTYAQTVTLQPNEAAALSNEQQLAQTLSGYGTNIAAANAAALETPLNFTGLNAPTSLGPSVDPMNYQNEANQAAEAAYAQGEGLIQPQQQYAQQQLASSLSNAGIPQTSAAYREQENLLANQQMAQNDNLAESAVGLGQGEQQALENEALNAGSANAALQNQAIQTNLQEQQLAIDEPINELSALLQGGGAIAMPSVTSPSQTGVSPTDVIGAQQLSTNAAEQNYSNQVAAANAGNQTLAGVGTAAATVGAAALIF